MSPYPNKNGVSNFDAWKNAVGPGWQPMVHALLRRADELGLEVHQVKEKFGTLRFYWGSGQGLAPEGEEEGREEDHSYFRDMVHGVELLTGYMCEECGQFGKNGYHGGGWVLTLCPIHSTLRNEKYKKEGEE